MTDEIVLGLIKLSSTCSSEWPKLVIVQQSGMTSEPTQGLSQTLASDVAVSAMLVIVVYTVCITYRCGQIVGETDWSCSMNVLQSV